MAKSSKKAVPAKKVQAKSASDTIKKWNIGTLVSIIVLALLSVGSGVLYFLKVKELNDYAAARPYLIAFVVVHSVCIFLIITLFLIFQTVCGNYFDKNKKDKKK